MNGQLTWLKRTIAGLRDWLDALSKLATIIAVVIAGIWTYHIHEITGESDINPELTLSAQTFDYTKDGKVLLVNIHEKNVGKIPILLAKDALNLTVKRIPDGLKLGYVDMDKLPVTYAVKSLLARYDEETYLGAGTEFRDVAQLIVAPGLYHVEATLRLPDGDTVNDTTVLSVP